MTPICCNAGQSSQVITVSRGDHVLCFRWTGEPGEALVLERPGPSICWAPLQMTFGTKVLITEDVSLRVFGSRDYCVEITTPGLLTVTCEKC
jgi:hypothetical protein